MKAKNILTKKDMIVILLCIGFLILNLGAIGNSGRLNAKKMVCISNLYKWGTIYALYADDNGGSFTPGSGVDTGLTKTWLVLLKKYYIDDKMLLCPMATKPYWKVVGQNATTATKGPGYYLTSNFHAWGQLYLWRGMLAELYGISGSYCENGFACNPANDSEMWPGVMKQSDLWRTPNVAGGNNIPIMTDGMWMSSAVSGNASLEPPAVEDHPAFTVAGGIQRHCVNRHRGTVNSLFLDYSVRPVGLKELWKLKWNRNYDTANSGPRKSNRWPDWMKGFENFTLK